MFKSCQLVLINWTEICFLYIIAQSNSERFMLMTWMSLFWDTLTRGVMTKFCSQSRFYEGKQFSLKEQKFHTSGGRRHPFYSCHKAPKVIPNQYFLAYVHSPCWYPRKHPCSATKSWSHRQPHVSKSDHERSYSSSLKGWNWHQSSSWVSLRRVTKVLQHKLPDILAWWLQKIQLFKCGKKFWESQVQICISKSITIGQ